MPKCGVCGGGIALTVIPHGQICEDDRKAPARSYMPEKTINDLVKERAEDEGN